jgi:NAD(P)-dependent dehydrogenase (short-subunit alcohol dehydrogenase family)
VPTRKLSAFNAAIGAVLWECATPSGVTGIPNSSEIDGVQFVAVQSGWGVDAQGIQSGQHAATNTNAPQGAIVGLRVAAQVPSYAASKAALIRLTKAMALEMARHKIRVNALAPGYIETGTNREFFASEGGQALIKRIPQRRIGQPEELEAALLLFASNASSHATAACWSSTEANW